MPLGGSALLDLAHQRDAALGMAFGDGTTGHQNAAGAEKSGGSRADRDRRKALGYSRGSYSTKAASLLNRRAGATVWPGAIVERWSVVPPINGGAIARAAVLIARLGGRFGAAGHDQSAGDQHGQQMRSSYHAHAPHDRSRHLPSAERAALFGDHPRLKAKLVRSNRQSAKAESRDHRARDPPVVNVSCQCPGGRPMRPPRFRMRLTVTASPLPGRRLPDQDALLAALDSGQVSWAGVDVFAKEPLESDSAYRTHPRVVSTPHLMTFTEVV
jgi:hypothetical protein